MLVQHGHCGWFAAYSVVLFLNVLGSMAYFFGCIQSGQSTESSGITFALSIIFFVLFVPCSFICWYRPLYKAFRFDSVTGAVSEPVVLMLSLWTEVRITRKPSCRWQTRVTLEKSLHSLRKSSGVVSCIARLPIDSVPMVSYYVLYSNCVCKMHRFGDTRLLKLPWPWNPGQGSIKVIETDTIR